MMKKAKTAGLAGLVITDHVLIDSQPEALEAAEEFGLRTTMGIELYGSLDNKEVHILGYRFNPTKELMHIADTQRAYVDVRMRKIVDIYNQHGYDFSFEDLKFPGYVSRHDLATYVSDRFNMPLKEADMHTRRAQYGGKNGFAVVEGHAYEHTMEEVITAIQNAGGIASIAHPGTYDFIDEVMEAAIDCGITACETNSKRGKPENLHKAIKYAGDANLRRTGGSDYHGARKSIKLGDQGIPEDEFIRLLYEA
jgi:predicted metal-dependent phosphoesterase TrpH